MCLNHQHTTAFNQAGADAFADRMIQTLNEGALCLMTSIGHRTGLFDTLAALPPATSGDIARASGLEEHYVREWLGAMTTARVVVHDPQAGTYHLPVEHAAFLSREGGDNIAVYAQYIPLLGRVEDDIVQCFHQGGGVPYERYPRFHEVMAEDSGQTVVAALLDHILPLVPGLIANLERGVRVLDVGCGRGRALATMAARFPRSTFVGYDLSTQAIETARSEAGARRLTNIHFEARDLSDFDQEAEPGRFDLITSFDAVLDQARPRALLRGIQQALKDDGVYLMQDIRSSTHVHNNLDHPVGTLLYTVSCMHCMSVSLAQGGEGLGAMWGREQAEELLREAGFTRIEIHTLEHDFQNDYYVVHKH
ncbi:MAG TPA: class I SAM-dependent methyltransferase [Thioalkalivibrio sp.]|nr:class I SAM-dependent methyltransferase [Thioalkalivibrio sp.]